MPRLDQTLNKNLKILEQEVRMNVLAAIKDGTFHEWKGRKIISVKEWYSIASVNQYRYKWLQHIPADFVEHQFYYHPEDEREAADRKKWYDDWMGYLEFKKNPLYGKFKCQDCILNPSPKLGSTFFRDLFIEFLLEFDPRCKFPCDVVNWFKCPYDVAPENPLLYNLQYFWESLDEALAYAKRLTLNENRSIDVDFQTGRADDYPLATSRELQYKIEQLLLDFKFSSVPIRNDVDIYDVITDKKKLDLLFEQYIKYLEGGTLFKHTTRLKPDGIRIARDFVIGRFMEIKDKISREKLGGLYEILSYQTEPDERIIPIKHNYNGGAIMPPQITVKSGSCITCGTFANIHCINCDTWVCTNHWRKHGLDTHNFKLKESI